MALNVVELGQPGGRPVLALHGITGHALRWRGLAAELPDVRLLAVDLRGHGHSPWAPPWHVEQHVADALAVLDEHGLDRVPVIGHSFGGTIAVHLARAAPERVARLVLLDPALGLDPQAMLTAATDTCAGEVYPDRASARAEKARGWEGVPGAVVDDELDAHLVEEGGRFRYRYATPAVVAAFSEIARPAVTPPPGMPTLLVPATKVDYVRPEWVERLRAELGERLTVHPMDTGHMVYLEQPVETAGVITAFL